MKSTEPPRLEPTDPVSRFLSGKNLKPHYEQSTAHKKIRWDMRPDLWVAVHIRTKTADFRVEFADPDRKLKHKAIYEVGNQFEKNGGRNFLYNPKNKEEVSNVIKLAKEWFESYKLNPAS